MSNKSLPYHTTCTTPPSDTAILNCRKVDDRGNSVGRVLVLYQLSYLDRLLFLLFKFGILQIDVWQYVRIT